MTKPDPRTAYLAERAKLSLSAEEMDAMDADLSDMIAFADLLASAAVFQAESERGMPRVRPDLPREGIDREILLAETGGRANGYITVPLTIREDEHA